MSEIQLPPPEERKIEIRGDTIKLGQLIKVLGLVSSGAEVKEFLQDGYLRVNGESESRRGRKIHPGDVINLPSNVLVRIVGMP